MRYMSSLIVSILFLLTTNSYALPTQDQINMTYALTYGLVAYKLHLPRMGEFTPPEIEFLSSEKLCKRFYGKSEEFRCGVRGAWHKKKLLMQEDLDYEDILNMSILAHEFVHFFQEVAHGPIKSCSDSFLREKEAYEVQGEILTKSDYAHAQEIVRQGVKKAADWYLFCQRSAESGS